MIAYVEPTNKKLYGPMLNMDGSAAANRRFLDAAIPGEMFLHFPGIAAGMETLLPSLLSKGLLYNAKLTSTYLFFYYLGVVVS